MRSVRYYYNILGATKGLSLEIDVSTDHKSHRSHNDV